MITQKDLADYVRLRNQLKDEVDRLEARLDGGEPLEEGPFDAPAARALIARIRKTLGEDPKP